MLYPFCGAYASLFKVLAKYHFGDVLTPRIKVEIIYGSEGGNSYELAKEFVIEFIEMFKHINFILGEIDKIAKKNKYTIRSLESETKKYLNIYLKHHSPLLKATEKDHFEQHKEKYKKKKFQEKIEEKIGEKIEENINGEGEKRNQKERVRNKKNKKEELKLYNNYNYELQADKVSLILDFKSGNDFQMDIFFERSKDYDLNLLLFFISTYAEGSFPNNALKLETELTRIENNLATKEIIGNVFYSCVGLGNKLYGDKEFCKPIKKCDTVCSYIMNRFNDTIKICETENMEAIFFNWKVDIITVMFFSIYIYYFYNDFMQIYTIFPVSLWNRPLCLSNCCVLLNNNLHRNDTINFKINKMIGFHNTRLSKVKAEKREQEQEQEQEREQEQSKFIFFRKKTEPFEINIEKNGNKEETEVVGDPCTNFSDRNCLNLNSCQCQTEDIEKCEETCKESQTDRATDDMDNMYRTKNMNDELEDMEEEEEEEETQNEVKEHFEDDMEDLLKENKNNEMLTTNQRNKLMKEGYKIIGSHSAVKLCRWTKSQLRGRGGCYKNSFYGIKSYQCMETTPSLACANKCVFCWRHHKNPVGKEWNWKMDNPEFIVKESIEKHRKMIKELKGMYGVIPERFEEAFNIKHCALSLVGEPIMYPKINNLIDELHRHSISTFFVTNAQFPKELKNLKQVTQLYVSIDASNEKRLKNIDRPLFKDFWKRYIECIKILKTKKERTVFRFTLVKEYNMMIDEMKDYSNLVELGCPDFIEIKAATYCGSSQGYQLTMKNIPWYEEVHQFAQNLINASFFLRNNYELACQHKHSCSILIANKKFKINEKWHTWINYEKFHSLIKNQKPFDALDYCAMTPEWALCGSKEEGFNPMETRVFTKGKHKQTAVF